MKARKTYLIRRLTYSLIYLLLIGWPIYRIYLGALRTPRPYQYALIALSSLVVLGLLKDRSELVITYYVATTIILQVNNIGVPSAGEVLIYSLIILHGDIIVKALIYGVGLRKIRTSLRGYLITVSFVGASLIAYLMGGYLSAKLFIGLEKASVTSSSLSEAVLNPFLNTRVGSLTVIILSAALTSYILTEYLGGISSGIIGLNPQYAERKMRSALTKAFRLIVSGKTWHDRLWSYSVLTFLSLILWVVVAPAYKLGVESVPYLMKVFNINEVSGIIQLLSIITGIALVYITYRAIRGAVAKAILPKPFLKESRRLNASYGWIVIPAVMLITYLLILVIYPPMNSTPSDTMLRVLGLSSPRPGASWHILNSFINNVPAEANQYVQEVVKEFNWLIYIARLIMNILWGS